MVEVAVGTDGGEADRALGDLQHRHLRRREHQAQEGLHRPPGALGDTQPLFHLGQSQTPPFEDSIPPSKRATTDLLRTDDKPVSGSVGSFMAGVVSGTWRGSAQATKSYVISTVCSTSANLP